MTAKRIILVIIFLIACIILGAQNLVVNGNFDTLSGCPNAEGQLNIAIPWKSARGTCDLFNTCSTGSQSVPTNICGNQTPRSGNSYAGFFAAQGMWTSEVREYLHAQLRAPLIAGHTYCVSFYVNLSDAQDSWGDYNSDMAVNDLGAYFSSTMYAPDPFNFAHLPVTPQVVNPSSNQLTSRNNWMQVSGSFTAVGGENYITIGSFSSNANQDTTELDFWQSSKTSYYYLDDVSVTDCSVASPLSVSITGANNVCYGSQINLTANGVGGSPSYQYNWNNTGFSTNVSFVTTAMSDSLFTLDIKDASGAISSSTYSVNVIPLPNGNVVSDTTVCENAMLSLVASGGTSYQWYDGAFGTVQTTSADITIEVYGDRDLVVGISNGVCVDLDTVAISTVAAPPINVSNDTSICIGQSVSLEVNGIGNYHWETGSTNGTISVQPTATTNYWVSVSNVYCVSKDSVTVTIIALPLINAGNDKTICEGQSTSLTAVSSGAVVWSNGLTNNTINVSPLITTTFYASTTTGQCANTDSVQVNVVAKPIADAGSDVTSCEGNNLVLVGTGGGTYVWSVGINNDTAIIVAQQTSLIVLTVSNGICNDKDTVKLTVIPLDESPCKEPVSSIEVPNIFSPNGDGVNDVFQIKTIEISDYEMGIYNRWGHYLFSLTPSSPVWDGTIGNGKNLNDGTYYYILKAEGNDKKQHESNGFIELVR